MQICSEENHRNTKDQNLNQFLAKLISIGRYVVPFFWPEASVNRIPNHRPSWELNQSRPPIDLFLYYEIPPTNDRILLKENIKVHSIQTFFLSTSFESKIYDHLAAIKKKNFDDATCLYLVQVNHLYQVCLALQLTSYGIVYAQSIKYFKR